MIKISVGKCFELKLGMKSKSGRILSRAVLVWVLWRISVSENKHKQNERNYHWKSTETRA